MGKKIIWLNVSMLAMFIIDRFSKWLALHALPREGFFIIPKMTGFILERNQGIAYSITLTQPLLLIVLSIIIFVLVAFLVRAYQQQEVSIILCLSLIIIGAVSNLLDRLRYEYVIDMIVLTSWPVFNLADVFILAGAGWLILKIIKDKKNESRHPA